MQTECSMLKTLISTCILENDANLNDMERVFNNNENSKKHSRSSIAVEIAFSFEAMSFRVSPSVISKIFFNLSKNNSAPIYAKI